MQENIQKDEYILDAVNKGLVSQNPPLNEDKNEATHWDKDLMVYKSNDGKFFACPIIASGIVVDEEKPNSKWDEDLNA